MKQKTQTRIYNRFKAYTLADCDCSYCLYGNTRKKICSLKECACAKEKAQAFMDAMVKAGIHK